MTKRLWAGALGLALCFVACDGKVGDGMSIDEVDGDGGPDGASGDGGNGTPRDGRDGSSQDGAPGDGDEDGATGDGAPNDGSPGDGDGDGAPEGLVPGVISVGYGGLRAVSRDHGRTWSDGAGLYTSDPALIHGAGTADNEFLLRGIAWGNERWIATGQLISTSRDGVNWSEPKRFMQLSGGCGLVESIAFDGSAFVGACGDNAYLTTDGDTWQHGGSIGNVGGHPKIGFAQGQFVVSGDNGSSFTSRDGRSWAPLDGVSFARVCDGEIKPRADCPSNQNGINDVESIWVEDGTWLIGQWGGHIWHSTNGAQYERVYTEPHQAAPFGFAAGFVAP